MDPATLLEAPAGAVCRICHGTSEDGSFLSPCLCAGSVRFVHTRCLSKWRLQGQQRNARVTHCELCGFQYRYEVIRSSRCASVSCVLLRSLAIATPFVTLGAIVAHHASPRSGFVVAGSALCAWMGVDLQPLLWSLANVKLPLGLSCCKGIASEAVQQFLFWVKIPTGEAEDLAEKTVQARAVRQATSAARAIAEIRAVPQRVELTPMSSEASERSMSIHAEEGPAVAANSVESDQPPPDAETGDSGDVPCADRSEGTEDAEDPVEERDNDDGFVVEFLSTRDRSAYSVNEASANSRSLSRSACYIGLGTFSALGLLLPFLGGLWGISRKETQESTDEDAVLMAAAIFGTGYWCLSFLLILATAAIRPPPREPKRGTDGFYNIRNISDHERVLLGSKDSRGV